MVGIVAGRLKDRFAKPAFVAGFEGGMGRGSARSIPGIDIGAHRPRRDGRGRDRSWRRPCHGGGLLADGGAARARSSAFLAAQFAAAGAALAAAQRSAIWTRVVSPAGADGGAGERDRAGRPFGAGNPEPLLALPDVRVAFADVVGKDHVQLRLAGRRWRAAGRHRFPRRRHAAGRGAAGGARQAHPCRRAAAAATTGTAGSGSSCRSRTPPPAGRLIAPLAKAGIRPL